jgi:hypothetical protein
MLPILLLLGSSGCETEALREARKLTYPRDMAFEAVLINEDKEWTVSIWEGDGPIPSGESLKPGERMLKTFLLHFDRPFEIRTLSFNAEAHGRIQVKETLQIRPADQPRIGVVFSRTAEGNPDIYWLSNPSQSTKPQ